MHSLQERVRERVSEEREGMEKVHSGTRKVHTCEEADVWGECDRVRFSQQLTAPLIQNVPLAIYKIHIMRHMLRFEVKAIKWLPDIRRRHPLMF